MKKITFLILVMSFLMISCNNDDSNSNNTTPTDMNGDGNGDSDGNDEAIIWEGDIITFEKTNNTDWTLEANQDRLTDNVWITRANNNGLFNIVNESTGNAGDANSRIPTDTEWAYGTTENYNTLTYGTLNSLINQNFNSIVDGQDMVLHLITDDIYIDLKFISWQAGNVGTGGGGFSYERSTMN